MLRKVTRMNDTESLGRDRSTLPDPLGLGTDSASGDQNDCVVFAARPDQSGRTMCSAEINTGGYVCQSCGAWIPSKWLHSCQGLSYGQRAQVQVQSWSTAEWLILRELQRIASALEKLAGSTNPQATPGTQEASQCQAQSLPLSRSS